MPVHEGEGGAWGADEADGGEHREVEGQADHYGRLRGRWREKKGERKREKVKREREKIEKKKRERQKRE